MLTLPVSQKELPCFQVCRLLSLAGVPLKNRFPKNEMEE
jgi:hypothetical protein